MHDLVAGDSISTWLYATQALVSFVIVCICGSIFFLWTSRSLARKVANLVGVNAIVYLISSFLYMAWTLQFLVPNELDFILIEGALTILKAMLILVITYKLTGEKNLLYILFLFLLSGIAISSSVQSFFLFISTVSYAVVLLVSAYMINYVNRYLKWAGYCALLYASLSIVFTFIGIGGVSSLNLWWFIPNSVMIVFFLLLYKDVAEYGVSREVKVSRSFLPLTILKFVIFVIALNVFLIISTVSIHELGHALAANYYDCERTKAVIYEPGKNPHTEIVCKGYFNDVILTLSGLAATLAIGLIFLITGGTFTTILSIILFGYSLIIIRSDFEQLFISPNITAVAIAFGVILVFVGCARLGAYYVSHELKRYKDPQNAQKYLRVGKKEVKNLYQLLEVINEMGNKSFQFYVNEKKNDFAKWAGSELGNEELAKQMKKVENKKEMQAVILTNLLKENSPKEYIKKFVCYPLLKDEK